MIYKHPYGVSPTLSVIIDGAPVAYDTITKVEMFLECELHDMLILHLVSLPTRASLAYRNKGIQVTLDNGGNYVQEFTGYVIEVRPTSVTHEGTTNGSPFQDAQLVCMGASYAMRGATSRIWTDHRLQDVVDSMAFKYGFSADVPNDPLVYSPMVQDNESDWQFLLRYSKLMGYTATFHSTHLHIFDPHSAVERGISYNKLVSGKDVNSSIAPHPGNIAKFSASLANHHPDGVYKDTVVVVHGESDLVFDVSLRELRGISAPAAFTDRLATSADSYEQAVRSINARSREVYDFTATAEVLGLAGCKPGGVVNVDRYDSEVDGLWFVHSVTHRLNSGIFVSELGLRRNIESELVQSTPTASVRTPPAPKLVNNRWTSSKKVFSVYS